MRPVHFRVGTCQIAGNLGASRVDPDGACCGCEQLPRTIGTVAYLLHCPCLVELPARQPTTIDSALQNQPPRCPTVWLEEAGLHREPRKDQPQPSVLHCAE